MISVGVSVFSVMRIGYLNWHLFEMLQMPRYGSSNVNYSYTMHFSLCLLQ